MNRLLDALFVILYAFFGIMSAAWFFNIDLWPLWLISFVLFVGISWLGPAEEEREDAA